MFYIIYVYICIVLYIILYCILIIYSITIVYIIYIYMYETFEPIYLVTKKVLKTRENNLFTLTFCCFCCCSR